MSSVKKGLLELLYSVVYGCKVVIKVLPAIIIAGTPFVSMFVVVHMYQARGYFRIGGEWLLPFVLYVLAAIIHSINKAKQDSIGGLPVARKRFTKRDAKGMVLFNSSDIYEMVEYLAEVEDYCEKYGKYRGVK